MPELFIVGHWNSLADALEEIQSWNRDAEHFNLGPDSVFLGFKNQQWLVLISEELMDAFLPH